MGFGAAALTSPRLPNRKAKKEKSSQGAQRYLTVISHKPPSRHRKSSPDSVKTASTAITPPSSCQPKPEFHGISTCCSFHNPACPTDSFLFYVQFLSHTLYTRKNFSITDQPVFAYRQPCAFGCIMIAVRYSPCSSQAEKRGVGNDGVRWRLGFGGSAVRQVTLCVGGTGLPWGCHPIPRLGISSPNPISASRRLNAALTESGFASLPDSRL